MHREVSDGSCLQMHIRSGIRYFWTISDFTRFHTEQYLESGPLHFHNGNQRKTFNLKVIKAKPIDVHDVNKDSYFLHFNFRERFLEEMQYHIRYCVCNKYGIKITKLETIELQIIEGKVQPFYLNLIAENVLKESIDIHGSLVVDVFMLDVTFPNFYCINQDIARRINENHLSIIDYQQHSLVGRNFSHLYGQDSSSDVILLVKDNKFLVHKIVLITKSTTFSLILLPRLGKNQKLCMSIDDFDPPVVANMLKYMYLNSVQDIDEMAFALYNIAKRYNLEGLANSCASCIMKKTNDENAMMVLFFAVKHNIDALEENTKNFIKLNVNNVLNSGIFKRMINSYDFQEHGL